MRWLAMLIGGMLLTGCANRVKPAPPVAMQPEVERENYWYEARTASALAFPPPVVSDAATPNLSRAGRGEAAYVGFDEVITTHFYLRHDDRQVIQGSGPERYERRAISERTGVSYR